VRVVREGLSPHVVINIFALFSTRLLQSMQFWTSCPVPQRIVTRSVVLLSLDYNSYFIRKSIYEITSFMERSDYHFHLTAFVVSIVLVALCTSLHFAL
jgi:hypothetical protein